jgi:hypothetical protein
MKSTILQNLSRLLTSAVLIASFTIAGCNSDNNSSELAKALELERQRAQGSIIELVTIVDDHIRLRVGESHQLRATGIDSNNETRDITNELIWSSSDLNVATVNNKGLVTAIANSPASQGLVIIIGTTINDIYDEGEISVSDAEVTSITLKQTSPETGIIYTCIDASIKGDVGYKDNYTSLNTIKDMTFSLDENTSATINTDGTLYTSAAALENSTITARIADISGLLTVTADPQNLDHLDILLEGEPTTLLSLNVGDRIQVDGRANLVSSVSESDFNINNTISWSQEGIGHVGITRIGEYKGAIFALKPGVIQLIGTCGGKRALATLDVTGEANLDSIQINDGSETITLVPSQSIELTLTANYTTTSTSLNVSEFAEWSINGSSMLTAELIDLGTNVASYKLTSTSSASGVAIVSVIYDGVASSVYINIE